MSLMALFLKNTCHSSIMSALSIAQSTCTKSMPTLTNFAAFSSSSTNKKKIYLPKNISNKMILVNAMFSKMLSTQRPLLCESKSKEYQGKTLDFSSVEPVRGTEEPSKFKKAMRNLFINKLSFLTSKSILAGRGFVIYQLLSTHVLYKDFFEAFSMPDTFNSWFLVMELHVWMLSVRLMAEGPDGKKVRNAVVEAMWVDVEKRIKTISSVKQTEESLTTLSGQFNAGFVGYDEGLLSDDKVLASAVWRRFFNKECDDPLQIESLVSFIRKQLYLLDQSSREDLIENQKFYLLSLSQDQR